MSPNPRSRIKYSTDAAGSGLIIRLNLLLFFIIVQVVMTIGLWVEVADLKKSLAVPPQAAVETTQRTTEPQRSTAQVAEKETVTRPEPEAPPLETAKSLVKADEIEPSPIRLQVLNGCGVAGIAGRIGKWLDKNGYDVVDVGNADRQDYHNSRILDRSGNLTAARELAGLLGLSETRIKRLNLMPEPEIDLTLIVGKDNGKLSIGR